MRALRRSHMKRKLFFLENGINVEQPSATIQNFLALGNSSRSGPRESTTEGRGRVVPELISLRARGY